MTRKILLKLKADRDIEEEAANLAKRGVNLGLRFEAAVEVTLNLLLTSPYVGGVWESPDANLIDVRVWPIRGFRNHLVLYRITDDALKILRVLHGARDLPPLLADEVD